MRETLKHRSMRLKAAGPDPITPLEAIKWVEAAEERIFSPSNR
jgi:hypothetical protein